MGGLVIPSWRADGDRPTDGASGARGYAREPMDTAADADPRASARRAYVLNVCRDGVVSASADPLLEGIPPLAVGAPLGGPFFPLLLT